MPQSDLQIFHFWFFPASSCSFNPITCPRRDWTRFWRDSIIWDSAVRWQSLPSTAAARLARERHRQLLFLFLSILQSLPVKWTVNWSCKLTRSTTLCRLYQFPWAQSTLGTEGRALSFSKKIKQSFFPQTGNFAITCLMQSGEAVVSGRQHVKFQTQHNTSLHPLRSWEVSRIKAGKVSNTTQACTPYVPERSHVLKQGSSHLRKAARKVSNTTSLPPLRSWEVSSIKAGNNTALSSQGILSVTPI